MQNFSDEIQIDLSVLPTEARKELTDMYLMLLTKYAADKKHKENIRKDFLNNFLPKPVEKFIPLKRDEIYVG